MRQMVFPKAGPPDVMRLEEHPDPVPKVNEVRVRAVAAGINFADVMARMGLYPDAPPFPCVVGYEVAGHVDAVGADVRGVAEGDAVAALTRFGGYSDVVCVPAEQVFAVPSGGSPVGRPRDPSDDSAAPSPPLGVGPPRHDSAMTASDRLDRGRVGSRTHPTDFAHDPLASAAGLPVTYLTAWLMLVHLGNVQAGDRVLVHSAGGGVGLSALQICKWRGAEVLGTASAGKHARLREMGVAHCIDYRSQDFEAEVMRLTGGDGVDIVLDAQGGESLAKSYRCLDSLGRLYAFGAASFAPGETRSLWAAVKGWWKTPRWGTFDLMDKNRGVQGVNLGHLWHRVGKLRGMMEEIAGLWGDGVLAPVIDSTFPLEEAAAAHAHIQARGNFGKVLLTM